MAFAHAKSMIQGGTAHNATPSTSLAVLMAIMKTHHKDGDQKSLYNHVSVESHFREGMLAPSKSEIYVDALVPNILLLQPEFLDLQEKKD